MKKTVWSLLLLASCQPPCPDPSAHQKKEEERTDQVTVWGDRFEIFLEHKAIVSGRPTAFVTHVTDLKTFQPRREGKVSFVLKPVNGPEVVHVEDAPKRDGIYIPDLRFPEPGEWTLALRIPVDGAEVVEVLPHVHVHATLEDAGKGHGHEHESFAGISFLKEQQWKLPLRTEPAGGRRMVERLRLPAVVLPRPGGRAAVAPPLAGRVLPPAPKGLPALGARVEAGEILALLQPPLSDLATRMAEAEADVAKTKLALDQAGLAHERVKRLAAGQARTERELQESEFALQAAKAAHQAALALKAAYEKSGAIVRADTGNLPAFELRSPIAGTVIHVAAAPGEYVPADRPLFTVLDAGSVLLEARIPESDLARVGNARDAVYETPDAPGRFVPVPGETGRVLLFAPEVDPATRTASLVYEVKNPEGRLRIGLSLNLFLETARAAETLAIPESALVDEEGRFVAFVQVSGETFQKRDLKLGLRDSGFAQVLDGLAPDDRVVTRGAYAVRLASLSTSLPAHGHAH